MTTVLHFKDGHTEVLEDAAPFVDVEEMTINGVLEDSSTYGDDVPLGLIASVEFIP